MTGHTCKTSIVYRGCPACRRNENAWSMTAGAFGVTVCLTVAPIIPALVAETAIRFGEWAGAGVAGFLYIAAPILVGAATWMLWELEEQR